MGLYFTMEQATGIEPASAAWEAAVLPLNYACKFRLFDYTITAWFLARFRKRESGLDSYTKIVLIFN
jgi:hypothetical protein